MNHSREYAGIETRASLPVRPSKAAIVLRPLAQASGVCQHCGKHKVVRSHFGIAEAERRLEAQFAECRDRREAQGMTTG